MQVQLFPLNYLRAMWSPRQAFKDRKPLKKGQSFMVILVMISLMILPIGWRIGQLQIVSLDQFASEAMALLTDQVAQDLAPYAQGPQGQLVLPQQQVLLWDDEAGRVVLLPDEDQAQLRQVLSGKPGIAFTPSGFALTTANQTLLQQDYDEGADFSQLETASQLNRVLSQQWFQHNRLSVILTIFINAWLMLAVSLLIMLFGVAGFLSFMKFTPIFSIQSYGEAFRICLNCFGAATLLAVLTGFVTGNPAHVLTGLGIGFMAMLMWVYWTTHFQDQYLAQQEAKENQDAISD